MGRFARILYAFCLAVLTAAGAFAVEQPRVWDFQAFLDGKSIGYHRFTLTGDGDSRKLESKTRFEVKFLFITAYRYVHDATERWQGNCLRGLSARTDDNGERLVVDAASNAQGLVVNATKSLEALPGCVMSFAYWNPQILGQARLLNAQTGKLEAVNIALVREESIKVRGTSVMAKRFRITGPKNPIDLWYSISGQWLALESTVDGGRRLRYSLN